MNGPPETCIYPGCERPVVPPNPHGGPPSAFCELEEHNALSAHQERRRLRDEGLDEGQGHGEEEQ